MAPMTYGEGPYGQGPYGYADPEMIGIAVDLLNQSSNPLDRKLRVYLEAFNLQAQGSVFKTPPPAPIEALEEVVLDIDRQAKEEGILRKRSGGASSFFLILLDELRGIICGKGKTPKKLGTNSQAVLTALAAAATPKLGISDPTAMGVTVLMLITLGRATKKAFCKMSDLEELKLFRT